MTGARPTTEIRTRMGGADALARRGIPAREENREPQAAELPRRLETQTAVRAGNQRDPCSHVIVCAFPHDRPGTGTGSRWIDRVEPGRHGNPVLIVPAKRRCLVNVQLHAYIA